MDHAPIDAPPRDPHTDMAADEPPRWPGVVGVVSIVWASLGLVCGGCGLATPLIMQVFSAQAEQKMGPMPDVMKPGLLQMALGVVSMLWTVLLLAAGIMLTLRKPAARPMHLVYAAVAIVLTIVGTIVSVATQRAIHEWAANNPDNEWAKQMLQQPPAFAYAGIAFAVVLGLAWPIFCMIWFGAVKRTARDITGAAPA